jgi:Mg/Co/Ni transporter MgtE
MSKIKLSKYLVLISIFTFIAIFFSVVSQSYNNLIKSSEENQNNPLIRSVSPDLDIDVLDEIEKRQEVIFLKIENPIEAESQVEPAL